MKGKVKRVSAKPVGLKAKVPWFGFVRFSLNIQAGTA